MSRTAFLHDYFEDAYQAAARKRREVIDRGLLLIAHRVRQELPTATAITVNAHRLVAVHDAEGTIWRFNDDTSRDTLSGNARADVRDTLLDVLAFAGSSAPLIAADWKRVTDLPDTYRAALPDDQEQEAAPAAHGEPGAHAGNCAQCGRPLIWDGTGKRVHDEWGEYLCYGPQVADAQSTVHVLAAPATADDQPTQN